MFGSYNRYCYQQLEDNYYIRKNFEVSGFMSNPDKSLDSNGVSQFRNLLVGTIRDNPILPKLLVFIPEGDLINYFSLLGKNGFSQGIAAVLNWLMKEHTKILDIHKDRLPDKCKRAHYQQLVWIELPPHCNFSEGIQEARSSFNLALREIGKLHDNVSILELKKVWNPRDEDLFSKENNRFSAEGLKTFWLAVDRILQFCNTTIMKMVAKYKLKPPSGEAASAGTDTKVSMKTSSLLQSPQPDKKSDDTFIEGIARLDTPSKEREPFRPRGCGRRGQRSRRDHFDRYHWHHKGRHSRSCSRSRSQDGLCRYSYPDENFRRRPSHYY